MGQRHRRRDVFRYTAIVRGAVLVAFVVFLAGFVSTYRSPSRGLAFYSFLILSILGLVAVASAFRSRLELRDDDIHVVQLLGHHTYTRTRVVDAQWEAGCPVSLTFVDGTSTALPDLGHSSAKIAGAIRAWLNRPPPA
jgi:hypothetical protein